MRDPEASLTMGDTLVRRSLHQPLRDNHFLRTDLAKRWVVQNRLVPFDIVDAFTVVSPRMEFISYPSEWCDSQIFDAGQVTLQLQKEAVETGFDLKDASAWNVLFRGTDPIFCDLLSFKHLRSRKWWAAGQFSRHFIISLLLSRQRGLCGHLTFKMWRDGAPPDVSRQLIGPGRFLTRYWPLMADGRSSPPTTVAREAAIECIDADVIARFRRSLHTSLSWMLAGVGPDSMSIGKRGAWSSYVNERRHYDTSSVVHKQESVAEWITQLAPDWVVDLGCNIGEFSEIALKHGAKVVAIDADHNAIEQLYRSNPRATRLHPVIVDLDDMTSGRGWAGSEHPGLPQRLTKQFDLVMMLALIHHLAVAASVPLDAIASFAAQCTKRWLIVELIRETDSQLRSLCMQRQRLPAEFSFDRQRAAFHDAGFVMTAQVTLQSDTRVLALMRLSK